MELGQFVQQLDGNIHSNSPVFVPITDGYNIRNYFQSRNGGRSSYEQQEGGYGDGCPGHSVFGRSRKRPIMIEPVPAEPDDYLFLETQFKHARLMPGMEREVVLLSNPKLGQKIIAANNNTYERYTGTYYIDSNTMGQQKSKQSDRPTDMEIDVATVQTTIPNAQTSSSSQSSSSVPPPPPPPPPPSASDGPPPPPPPPASSNTTKTSQKPTAKPAEDVTDPSALLVAEIRNFAAEGRKLKPTGINLLDDTVRVIHKPLPEPESPQTEEDDTPKDITQVAKKALEQRTDILIPKRKTPLPDKVVDQRDQFIKEIESFKADQLRRAVTKDRSQPVLGITNAIVPDSEINRDMIESSEQLQSISFPAPPPPPLQEPLSPPDDDAPLSPPLPPPPPL